MDEQLQLFARRTLKNGLAQLPESHQKLFKRMYSHKNLDLDINLVVDQMSQDKLDWALGHVKRSLNKIFNIEKEA